MTLSDQLAALVAQVLQAVPLEIAPDAIHFERPTDTSFGDLATTVALSSFKQLSAQEKSIYKNPAGWAHFLAEAISKEIITTELKADVQEVVVAGPGFINFKLSDRYLLQELSGMQSRKSITQIKKPRIVIVEYSSPNIAKPFTVGHLRSTIIGSAIAAILEAVGYEVKRDNHLGDWGTQFGKLIVAIKKWGDIDALEKDDRPVKKLVELYVKFHEEAEIHPELEDEARAWFKNLEDGNSEAKILWQKCIDWSWKEFSVIYEQLDIHFSEDFNNGKGLGESFFENKMLPVIVELQEKKMLQVGKNGAQLVFFPNDELPPLMILKQDGATLYATRDLATDYYRKVTFGPDSLIVNEVGAEQSLYFKQIYKIEEMLGWFKPSQRVHVGHGLYRFKDKKMSTRKGNVIWLEDVLLEAKERAMAFTKDEVLAAQVGLGALKWNDLKRSSHLDVVFDWDEVLNLKGNSGPYVQYTVVRAVSILKKAQQFVAPMVDETLSLNAQEREIVLLLGQFNEVLHKAADEYAPHHLVGYLYELAQAFNTFYNQHSVLGKDVAANTQQLRLILTEQTAQVLSQGLTILGIEIPEKM